MMKAIYKLKGKSTPEAMEVSGVFYRDNILWLISNNKDMYDIKVYGVSDIMAEHIINRMYEYDKYDFTIYSAEEDIIESKEK